MPSIFIDGLRLYYEEKNGDGYKEYVMKTIWNTAANMLQSMYFEKFHLNFYHFNDYVFKKFLMHVIQGVRSGKNVKKILYH